MIVNIDSLTDKSGNEVFEAFGAAIERRRLSDGDSALYDEALRRLERIERELIDLSEVADVSKQNEVNVAKLVNQKTKWTLGLWLSLLVGAEPKVQPMADGRVKVTATIIDASIVLKFLQDELLNILTLLVSSHLLSKQLKEINFFFDNEIILRHSSVNELKEKHFSKSGDTPENSEAYIIGVYHLIVAYREKQKLSNAGRLSWESVIQLSKRLRGKETELLADGEHLWYHWKVFLWIDTTNASDANKFMNLFSSVLSYIENVDINITDTGVGSFFQEWKMKFRGWIAKDETQQVLKKAVTAAEAYALERHIEPVEKSKSERRKTEEETRRMMSVEQTEEFHQLTIEEKRETVKAKKLENLKQEIQIKAMLSEMLAKGLVEIDSDYKIMINDLLLIKQEKGVIQLGESIEKIDENSLKTRIDVTDKS